MSSLVVVGDRVPRGDIGTVAGGLKIPGGGVMAGGDISVLDGATTYTVPLRVNAAPVFAHCITNVGTAVKLV